VATYIRRALGNGRVKFIAGGGRPATLLVPAAAGLLSIWAISALFPRLLAIVAVGVGAYVFYWLRRKIRQRFEAGTGFFVASPAEVETYGRRIPREEIREVTWRDFSLQPGTLSWPIGSTQYGRSQSSTPPEEQSALFLETIAGESIILVHGLTSSIAAQVTADLGQTLGVPTSGGRS
jgi:hypothetical protein